MLKVHCQPKHDDFLANGYYEARGYAPEDKAEAEPMLIFTMLPGQGLQPHSHDLDENMRVGWVISDLYSSYRGTNLSYS